MTTSDTEQRCFEALKRHPEYTHDYETRPRTCYRPGCETVLTDPLATFCQGCKNDLQVATKEIHAIIAQAKAERLARQGAQQ